MRELGRIVYLGLMAGVLGTGTGGLLLSYLKRPRDDFLGFCWPSPEASCWL